MTRITHLQPVNYDRRTDQIDPIGPAANAQTRALVSQSGYSVMEPVLGWAPYTHLIDVQTYDHKQIYLATLV